MAFFCLNISVNASSFAYNAFDWDKFYNEHIDYWTDFCQDEKDEELEEECVEMSLAGKKEYYIKLYKLLAKFEKQGYKLDDNILIETTFFGLTPDSFSDSVEEYVKHYRNGSAYNIDLEENVDTYDVNTDEQIEYFLEEKDSLKTLMKHMFAYNGTCTGEVATPEKDEEGNLVCYKGTLKGNSCVGTIDTYTLNYSEYLLFKFQDSFLGSLFGLKNEYKAECESQGGTYSQSNT